MWLDIGPGWTAVMLDNAQAVLKVEPSRYSRGLGEGLIDRGPEDDANRFIAAR